MRPSGLQMSLLPTNLQPRQPSNVSVLPQREKVPRSEVASQERTDGLLARLQKIDWNFPLSDEAATIHAIHPYPAKFISDIPRALIRELGVLDGSGVLDPFCGCGTTLAVAQELGVPSVGVDLNPIACLISRVKTMPLPEGFLRAAEEVVFAAAETTTWSVPLVPNVAHWFDLVVQHAVTATLDAISRQSDATIREYLEAALSSILVRVSRQESDTRYAAVDKNVSFRGTLDQFVNACFRLARAKEFQVTDARAVVMERDVLEVTPEMIPIPISLVITSPPYPNAYEYWLYHKYRMWWLGYDALAVKEREIGARAHYFKKNHATYDEFIVQMRQVLRLTWNTLVDGGYACFVLGRSRIHGVDFDNAAMMEGVACDEGFEHVARLQRAIAPTRKSFNLSHARIKTEEIVVLRKT